MKRLSLCAATFSLISAGWFPGMAVAQNSSTATFNVTLTIAANCIIAANNLAFGSHGVLSTALTGSTTLNVTCSNTTPYSVGLSAGTGTGSTQTTRFLSGTGANVGTISYQLYKPTGTSVVWGDAQVADRVSGTGSGSAQALVVNGTVPAQATPAPDNYSSTVTATVYF